MLPQQWLLDLTGHLTHALSALCCKNGRFFHMAVSTKKEKFTWLWPTPTVTPTVECRRGLCGHSPALTLVVDDRSQRFVISEIEAKIESSYDWNAPPCAAPGLLLYLPFAWNKFVWCRPGSSLLFVFHLFVPCLTSPAGIVENKQQSTIPATGNHHYSMMSSITFGFCIAVLIKR